MNPERIIADLITWTNVEQCVHGHGGNASSYVNIMASGNLRSSSREIIPVI
jgi:hypothetical protein